MAIVTNPHDDVIFSSGGMYSSRCESNSSGGRDGWPLHDFLDTTGKARSSQTIGTGVRVPYICKQLYEMDAHFPAIQRVRLTLVHVNRTCTHKPLTCIDELQGPCCHVNTARKST